MEVDSLPPIPPSSNPPDKKNHSRNPDSSHPVPPRVRLYPDGSSGPLVVYFRPKAVPKAKSLNIIQISKDLTSHYKGVIEISKVRPNKLRVVVNDLKQANDIASSELFTREYRVYVPARDVEIDGVVTDPSLTVEHLLESGVGCFKNTSLPEVKILDCKQLRSVSLVGGVKTYTPSDSFRVTFAGSALPSHVSIHRVRVPVRLYVPRVMNCLNCKQLGHTAAYCCNKARCGKCGENHADDSCSDDTEKCVYCGETQHELPTCSVYKQRRDKIKRSLKERSKRSYADILQKTVATSLTTSNPFDLLPSDETDSDDPLEGPSFACPGDSRKRKSHSSSRLPRKGPKLSQSGMTNTTKPKSAAANPKQTPPGLEKLKSQKEFPALPGTPKIPAVPFTPSDNQSKSGLIKFSDIVDWIFEAFNIPDPLKNLLAAFLPTVRTLLKQFAAQWPLLAAIVSFDG